LSEESNLSLFGHHYIHGKRKREKSSGKIHLFNIITIEAMDGTAGQAQVKLRCSVFFLNLTSGLIDPSPAV
jgi:hypothetical protein